MNEAKIFICHHPNSLFLYKNLIQRIRKYKKNTAIILFKVNHIYFLNFDFAPYKKYFDKIIEFDFIKYEKNLLVGIWRALTFQRKLKEVESILLTNFKTIDLFSIYSSVLPINVLLSQLSKNKKVRNIITFTLLKGLESSQAKTNKIKTLFCNLYSSFLHCYKVKIVSGLDAAFTTYIYTDEFPGTTFKMISPDKEIVRTFDNKRENVLPYPIIKNIDSSDIKKDMVVIFGDESVLHTYSSSLPDYKKIVEKLTALFEAIGNKYPDCSVYYKPHPIDGKRIMPGIDNSKYILLDNTLNAEGICDKYYERIKAVYALSSSSSIKSSFLGLPSYTFYKYLCNPFKIERIDNMFNRDNAKSKFLFHISSLREIGKIDNLKPNFIDLETLDNRYRKILNI